MTKVPHPHASPVRAPKPTKKKFGSAKKKAANDVRPLEFLRGTSDGASEDKISFRATPELIAKATEFAKREGYNG